MIYHCVMRPNAISQKITFSNILDRNITKCMQWYKGQKPCWYDILKSINVDKFVSICKSKYQIFALLIFLWGQSTPHKGQVMQKASPCHQGHSYEDIHNSTSIPETQLLLFRQCQSSCCHWALWWLSCQLPPMVIVMPTFCQNSHLKPIAYNGGGETLHDDIMTWKLFLHYWQWICLAKSQ